jgi:hypothetical protein
LPYICYQIPPFLFLFAALEKKSGMFNRAFPLINHYLPLLLNTYLPLLLNHYLPLLLNTHPFALHLITFLALLFQAQIKGKRVAVFGSADPFFEAVLLSFGAAIVVTVEYNKLTFAEKNIVVTTPSDFAAAAAAAADMKAGGVTSASPHASLLAASLDPKNTGFIVDAALSMSSVSGFSAHVKVMLVIMLLFCVAPLTRATQTSRSLCDCDANTSSLTTPGSGDTEILHGSTVSLPSYDLHHSLYFISRANTFSLTTPGSGDTEIPCLQMATFWPWME